PVGHRCTGRGGDWRDLQKHADHRGAGFSAVDGDPGRDPRCGRGEWQARRDPWLDPARGIVRVRAVATVVGHTISAEGGPPAEFRYGGVGTAGSGAVDRRRGSGTACRVVAGAGREYRSTAIAVAA